MGQYGEAPFSPAKKHAEVQRLWLGFSGIAILTHKGGQLSAMWSECDEALFFLASAVSIPSTNLSYNFFLNSKETRIFGDLAWIVYSSLKPQLLGVSAMDSKNNDNSTAELAMKQ